MNRIQYGRWGAVVIALATLLGCQTRPSDMPQLASFVDLDRFMGVWYVHGYTPTFLDRNARDATETYERREDGRIATTYRFRTSPDGDWKTFHPVGKVVDEESHAEWRMRFFWVISQPYLILHVDDAYEETLVGHPNRKMMWIMTRSPQIDEARYDRLVSLLRERGYRLDDLTRVPHGAGTEPPGA